MTDGVEEICFTAWASRVFTLMRVWDLTHEASKVAKDGVCRGSIIGAATVLWLCIFD